MKRFSKKWFSQIMIHKLLKKQLDELKSVVAIETNTTYRISYGDIISYLITEFKNSRRIEYTIEPKLLSGTSFSSTKLNVSVPLKKVSVLRTTKLDGKQRVSYSLES